MAVHVLIDVKVIDPALYTDYIKLIPPIVQKYGGRYLNRGGKITTIAGSWQPEKIILIEFDDKEQVNRWLNSLEYLATAPMRKNAAKSNLILIESNIAP